MKQFFTRLCQLFLLLFFPAFLYAQDYNLLLTSGKFIPEENINTISKSDPVFTRSVFGARHYVGIQFSEIPTQATKEQLKAIGVELLDYLPNFAYTAVVNQDFNPASLRSFPVRSIFLLSAEQKAAQNIITDDVPYYAEKSSGFADVDIVLYTGLSASDVSNAITSLGASIIHNVPSFRMFTLRIPKNNVHALAELPFVQWAEYIAPPNVPENLPGRTLHKANILNDGVRNLKGDGMNVGVFDERASQHLDFSPAGRLVNVDAGSAGSHGTHVSGTVGGKGIINPTARGMAPNATIYSYYAFSGDVQARMAVEIPTRTLITSNHSYHDGLGVQCGLSGASVSYSLRSRNTDINLNDNLYHLHCHSAGNAQSSCASGWGTITGTGKSAKNNVVVAAITSLESMTSYSSFGPIHDGRIKPEISAMGDGVFSTYTPLNTYGTISGTSMSTPGITGTLTLLAQRYKQLNGNALPPSALIKNIACNTAKDLGNAGPDYRFGFGCINALAAVRILEENRYALNNVSTGVTNTINISVPPGTARLRVMLTWNDPAAAANVALALVNNLDLRVVNGASTYLPWILDPNNPALPATQADDNISNIEQVTINNPPAGTYSLNVIGEAITTGPNQVYALTWDIEQPNIEVTYPNGSESFSPSTNQVITWTSAGVTGNQTVEYSIDNGSTWTTLSSTVASNVTRLTWSVPAANTSTALVRVTSGSITDVSDATFKILGTTTGFSGNGNSCTPGEITFSWTAVANATHYDIYRLDPATGDFVLVTANITSSPYTATGLTPGANMWFTIRAKNNTTGAESERANAINVTVSNGGGGMGIVGSISGQTIICGTPSGIPYSISAVSGATSYIWTVPSGAVIASGQGTTNITVNYPSGSVSGNVSVSASNGVCQTPPSTLAVSVGGSSVPTPLSGGNQSVTVCPGNPVPTLTATATVPSGYTLVWYNAATGGSIVASPTLNAAGTITYYAASRDNTTLCESITRTPVTLTITQVPTASVTAGGPVTFCQGGSVTLTANTGTSYLWSNGATTQAITVSAAGNYSVQVTTGSCVSTSPVTTVTVNPTPVANITAGGPVTFCQGLNVVLTASAGSSWLWSNGATTQSITVSTSGNHSVTVTNASGCSATSSATAVTVNPNPAAVITAGSPVTFCQGGSVMLTANNGVSYLWSNGATTQSITLSGPIGTNNYSVQVTQAGGCVSNSSATAVTVNALPTATIAAGGPTTFCEPNNVVLTASAGSSWAWSNGATSQSITVSSPAASGNYTVTVTNANGCSASSAATNVTVNPRPNISISASPYTRLFPGLSTTLSSSVTPSGSYTYTWLNNGTAVSGATSPTYPVTLSNLGSYSVRVVNGAGCSNTSNVVAIADSATAKLFIMPNPNNGQFEVSYYSAAANSFTLTISDSKGALVYSKAYTITSPYQRLAVDLRKNGSGIYTIALTDRTGKRIAVGRVMVHH
jgi:hypothetical protein